MWSAAAIWDGAESVLAADGGARGAPVLTLPRGEQGPLELPDPGLHPGLDVLLSCPLLPAPDPSFPPPSPPVPRSCSHTHGAARRAACSWPARAPAVAGAAPPGQRWAPRREESRPRRGKRLCDDPHDNPWS